MKRNLPGVYYKTKQNDVLKPIIKQLDAANNWTRTFLTNAILHPHSGAKYSPSFAGC